MSVKNVVMMWFYSVLPTLCFNTRRSVTITVGDFYHLPPIKAKHIFSEYKNDCFNISHPWSIFEMIELDQIMRQQGDDKFTELLNRVRIGSLTDEDCKILSERKVKKSDDNYPREAMHIWAENA